VPPVIQYNNLIVSFTTSTGLFDCDYMSRAQTEEEQCIGSFINNNKDKGLEKEKRIEWWKKKTKKETKTLWSVNNTRSFPTPLPCTLYLIRRYSVYSTTTSFKTRYLFTCLGGVSSGQWNSVSHRHVRWTSGGRKQGYPLHQAILPVSLSGATRLVWFPVRQTQNIM